MNICLTSLLLGLIVKFVIYPFIYEKFAQPTEQTFEDLALVINKIKNEHNEILHMINKAITNHSNAINSSGSGFSGIKRKANDMVALNRASSQVNKDKNSDEKQNANYENEPRTDDPIKQFRLHSEMKKEVLEEIHGHSINFSGSRSGSDLSDSVLVVGGTGNV
jgi:hypothetical protein